MGCGASVPADSAPDPKNLRLKTAGYAAIAVTASQSSADDQGAPDKAKVVQDVPTESREEAAANTFVEGVEGAREAVDEHVEQVRAPLDEATLVGTAVADAATSVLGTEVGLIDPASPLILLLHWNPFTYHYRATASHLQLRPPPATAVPHAPSALENTLHSSGATLANGLRGAESRRAGA